VTNVVDSDGVRIVWEEAGSGAPLLLVMGHRWSRRMWHPVLDRLTQHFRVISFDNRGSGESEAPPGRYRIGDMARDAVRVLDAAGVEKAHVFGVSLGGVVAQDLAIHHAERVDRLVLGCTGAVTIERLRLTRSRLVNYYLPDRVVNAVGRPLLYGRVGATPAIRRDLAVLAGETTTRVGLLGQAHAISEHAVDLEHLRALPHPTLVLHGGKDKVIPPAWGRELAELIPDARCEVYETAGHNFLATHAEETCAALTRFLSG
jgi:pimeloyl-ACP methyl ester carboxylesterase